MPRTVLIDIQDIDPFSYSNWALPHTEAKFEPIGAKSLGCDGVQIGRSEASRRIMGDPSSIYSAKSESDYLIKESCSGWDKEWNCHVPNW
jgi:hypothetical protein